MSSLIRGTSWFLCLAFSGVACASSPAPASPPTSPDGVASSPIAPPPDPAAPPPRLSWETKDLGVDVPEDWRKCGAAEDCELVVTTCCDQCNDGKAVSVARVHVADVRAKYVPQGCGACTERGCSTRAACESGRCVLQWQSFR
jgi:hypothetical protein